MEKYLHDPQKDNVPDAVKLKEVIELEGIFLQAQVDIWKDSSQDTKHTITCIHIDFTSGPLCFNGQEYNRPNDFALWGGFELEDLNRILKTFYHENDSETSTAQLSIKHKILW